MQSNTPTVDAYLRSLPPDRRAAISAVRDVIRKNLDASYEEGMLYGMIGYYVPHSVYPQGYHANPKQPLPFASLGSQKNYMALHLMSIYCECVDGDPANRHAQWFRDAWAKSGKKLDMGKACIRFKKIDDLPLDVIGEAVRRVPAAKYVEFCEASRAQAKQTRPQKKASRVAT